MGAIKIQANKYIQIISSHFKMIHRKPFPQWIYIYIKRSSDGLHEKLSDVK